MANLRGVRVHVIYLDREFKRKHEQNEELHRELYKTVSLLPSKEWEKIHKILLKHGYNISKV
jgi:ActR/RegA family two-component response regulator